MQQKKNLKSQSQSTFRSNKVIGDCAKGYTGAEVEILSKCNSNCNYAGQVVKKFEPNKLPTIKEGARPQKNMRRAKSGGSIVPQDTVHDYIQLVLMIVAMYGLVIFMALMKSWGWF